LTRKTKRCYTTTTPKSDKIPHKNRSLLVHIVVLSSAVVAVATKVTVLMLVQLKIIIIIINLLAK